MKGKIIALIVAIIVIIVAVVINNNNNTKTNNTNLANQENRGTESTIKDNNSNNNNNAVLNTNTENNTEENNNTSSNNKKILIAVFSKAGENYSVGNVEVGNTMIMAQNIHSIVGGDLFEIVPVNPYPNAYRECTDVAKKEQNENARPEIKNKVNNFDDYNTIFIGYPNWWGDMPMIVYTFLESYNFNGKTVIPFNTHEGSGSSGTYNTIKSKLSGATVLEGLPIQGTEARKDSSKSTIQNWINKLGL